MDEDDTDETEGDHLLDHDCYRADRSSQALSEMTSPMNSQARGGPRLYQRNPIAEPTKSLTKLGEFADLRHFL